MAKWRRGKIGEVAEIISGYAFNSKDLKPEGDIPVIKIGNITKFEVDTTTNMSYVESDFLDKLHRKYIVRNGDVLISLTGSNINQPNSMVGRVSKYRKDYSSFLNQRAGKVIPKNNTSQEWLYHFFSLKSIMQQIAMVAYGGANQVNISPNTIKGFTTHIPDIEIQEKIASILSAYDKLIENNNRRISLLEKAAEELYKERFIRMRFPGHENTKFINGIPEGWKVKRLGEILSKVESGKRPKEGSTSEESAIVSLGAGDIKSLGEYDSSKEYYIPKEFYENLKMGKVEDKDIAIYKDGAYVGKVTMFRSAFPYEKMAVNEHVFLVKTKETNIHNYILFSLKQQNFFEYIQIISMTSAQPGLNQKKLKSIKVNVPSSRFLDEFQIVTENILSQIFLLAKQNQNLIKQRDLLLPRLMSGKLEV